MNLLGFIMSLVYMQAVHGWLSTYERLVNSQNFFSPYLTQEDLSRLGRNQLHTGLYIEERFPMFGVRYIAINDNVDTENAESNDLMPFKNLFNEWFIRDTSRKIRAVQKAKAERGERLGTRAPYGYVKDLETKKLVIDEEAAAVVKRIFALCAAGNGPSRIATILTKEKVFCPSYYTYQKYGLTHSALDITKPYHWSDSAVANLLENEIYLGNTVNYRFSTKSYKDKRKIEHPREECLVFENTHPAIISKEVWDIVQRVRKNKRRPTKMNEQNKYSGLVVCADCGKAMVLHRAHTMSADYNHFTCRTYKKDGEACTAHYIRECILNEIVLEDLRRVTAEARAATGICRIPEQQTVRRAPKRDPQTGKGESRHAETQSRAGCDF